MTRDGASRPPRVDRSTTGIVRIAFAAPVFAMLLVLVLTGGGCQAIVSNSVPSFTCVGSSLTSCPANQYCKGSGCVACEQRDVCDTYDNDCNGKVDDGDLSDRDRDGYTFCGYVDAATQTLVFDCDDNDGQIRPGATETCNGKDDDCDGIIDNPGKACPDGQTCAPKLGQCVDPASVCSPQNCAAPKVCDADTQQCVTPNAGKTGDSCTSNRACTSGICGDAATLTPTIVDVTGNICTQPCCSSSECPVDAICYATGAGGNYCVPKAALKIETTLGDASAGSACTADSDCRSGACEPNAKRCIDTCCGEQNCGDGTTCRVSTTFRSKTSFACQLGNGNGVQNQPCGVGADCRSGYCFAHGGLYRHCVAPCCGSSQCGTVDLGFPFGRQDLACTNAQLGTLGNVGQVCAAQKKGFGRAPLGADCTADSSCASELCRTIGNNVKKCTDVCCTDADCAAVGWVCRPTSVKNSLYLRCVPK
jgi:hypothetical protein